MPITWMQLQAARKAAGLTQAQLAERLGVSHRTIVNWEANGVPRKSEHQVFDVLEEHLTGRRIRSGLGAGTGNLAPSPESYAKVTIGEASDEQLLTALMDRARARRVMFEGSPTTPQDSSVSGSGDTADSPRQSDHDLAAKKRSKNRGEVDFD